ncbi:sphingomyelin phosphodiesterase 5 isoform X3 [Equus asinus]|uniref:sphingomyelin phosphodiesterase 5 isoform X3 n=1 Tax=Equus asinus TaxID=9793 RepID=UPI001D0587C4|nr:sphingomyelin phosphodiesterase 5 isoform X3 [Equus asinus]
MQSPPDWPPKPGALRPSPFPHPVLDILHGLACALLFPAYWILDQLLGFWARATRRSGLRWLKAVAGVGASLLLLPLLLLVGLPLALPGFLLWLLLQVWRRPFCYQPPLECWTPPTPWRPPAEPARCFGFLSANLCLLPDGLARFSNLQHSQRRAEALGAVLLAGLRSSRYGATGCSSPGPEAPSGVLIAAVPAGLDFVCLQEVFDLRAARRLVNCLAPSLGPVLYDVGTFGLQPGPHLKLLGSGLLLASRYPLLRAAFWCFPHARREDALASKGLLSAQVQLGILDGRRVVGFLHCTHLHAPNGEPGSRDPRQVGRKSRLSLRGSGSQPSPAPPLPLSPFVLYPRLREPLGGPGWAHKSGPGGAGGGLRPRIQDAGWHPGLTHPCLTLSPPPEDGPLRCQQLTLLLDWAEQFEAESRQSDEAVAFSVLLGDLNFDNCSPDHAQEQKHQLFSRFQDPCRLGTRREQPWAVGTILNASTLCHSVACSPEMLRRALEQKEGRRRYLAGPPSGSHRAKPWKGRRVDYITYRGVPGGPLSPGSQTTWPWDFGSELRCLPKAGTIDRCDAGGKTDRTQSMSLAGRRGNRAT